ncbi:adenylate/guanylate cyclase domain-containing protein [Aeromicrobium sp. NPDC092404]|uniref:adenylate/guanylate cyclase domain-containing protein n=1 Tax=Aeromicrobium sp. NPDC092404 TaxID=3154976 RepID=UPI003430131F
MRPRDWAGPEVAALDAEPWSMPFAGTMRPFGLMAMIRLTWAAAFLPTASGAAGLAYAIAADDAARHSSTFVVFNCIAIALGVSMAGYVLVSPARLLRLAAPAVTLLVLYFSVVMVTLGVWSAGPDLAVVALAYIEAPLFAFYMLRLRWAVVHAAFLLGCFGVVLGTQDGWSSPWQAWLFAAANIIGTGVVMGQIAARSNELATSEHEARVELAELNHTLEDRVESQVAEIERLSGLRRFLSSQVADVVLAEDSAELSKPHRARIAVFFCDLRGFTAFTNGAEPEEVVEVLGDYYSAVGGLLQRYEATVGDYAGDGIMAYFGDPVPRDDAALAAVAMSAELGNTMSGVVAGWQRRGYDLDYGVGLAFGYATLGIVGFDGRYDYKPVGGVVNLAARLCARAGPREVLLDHATHAETDEVHASSPVPDLDLKGYGSAVRAYLLGAG